MGNQITPKEISNTPWTVTYCDSGDGYKPGDVFRVTLNENSSEVKDVELNQKSLNVASRANIWQKGGQGQNKWIEVSFLFGNKSHKHQMVLRFYHQRKDEEFDFTYSSTDVPLTLMSQHGIGGGRGG